MLKTKIAFKNNKYCLLIENEFGKFKQVFSDENKKIVEKERVKLQVQDETIVKKDLVKFRFVERYKEFAQWKLDLADQPSNRLQRSSIDCYMRTYNKAIKDNVPPNFQIRDFTVHYAKSFFLKVRSQGRSFKATRNDIMHIKAFMKYAVDNGWIMYNPLAEFSVKRYAELLPPTDDEMKKKKSVSMTKAEIKHLFRSNIPSNNNYELMLRFAIVTTFAFTGLRSSELAGMTWNNIDFEKNLLKVRYTVVNQVIRDRGKRIASQRDLFMPAYLRSILLRWKSVWEQHHDQKTQWLFPSLKTQTPLTYGAIRNQLLLAYQVAGFAKIEQGRSGDTKYLKVLQNKFKGCTSKTFRHFASTALVNAQRKHLDLHDNFVKRHIGHEDYQLTKGLYGDHIIDDEYSEEAKSQRKALNEIFDFGPDLNLIGTNQNN